MLRYALIALVAVGCKGSKKQPEPAPAPKVDLVTGSDDDVGVVQPRFSGGQEAPSDEGHLGFTITKVHDGQKPSETAPFHAPGGDWTYAEAHVDGDPAATFVVGLPKLAATKGGPGFGKLMLAPTTREAGARVIEHLAKTLRITAPPARPDGVLQAMKVPIAVLGHNIGKMANGLGGRGTWDATKLFCSFGDIDSAELFFNISFATKQGEFSEKDQDYNKDVVACLAAVLRDGLPPPRTPDTDPTLAATGPHLELGKKLGGRRMQDLAQTPARLLMIDERGTSAAVVEVDLATGAMKDLYTTKDRIDSGDCDDALARCVLQVSQPKERNVYASDPSQLMWFESGTATPLAIPKVDKPTIGETALSPDGRFVVVSDYESRPAKLVAFDRTTKQTFALPGAEKETTTVVGWDKATAIVVRAPYDEDKPGVVLDWQLDAKGATKPSKREATSGPSPLSPDGKRRAVFDKGRLTVTVGGKPRTLVFHPADARYIGPGCCEWIDSRWMAMHAGFIDTDAMKVSLLPDDPEGDPPRITYIRGTRSAIVSNADGTFLAKLVGP